MTKQQRGSVRERLEKDKGFTLTYMAVILTGLCLFTGLAVDSGRGYVVKAQLTKAVDGAALGAARALNSGDARAEAVRIFKANFPPGYMGTNTSPDPTVSGKLFLSVDRCRQRHQHRDRAGGGDSADDVHAARELPGVARQQPG